MKISELLERRNAAFDAYNVLAVLPKLTDEQKTEIATKRQAVLDLDDQIKRAKDAQTLSRSQAQVVGTAVESDLDASPFAALNFKTSRAERSAWSMGDYVAHSRAAMKFEPHTDKHFRGFGEFLRAVARYAHSQGSVLDNRLVRAPIGAGESDASAGGFLVQSDFATAIYTRAYDLGEILSRVMKLPISANANGIKIPAVDESSRATGSRWGGVQSYWQAEGDQATATKPKFRLMDLGLHKLMSAMYVSDELLQDQTALESIVSQAFSEEIMFMTEDAVIEGDGVGKPFGVLKSPALVTVAKDNGQAAATISLNNITNMWSRCWARSRKNAVWFINQDVEPQLYQLSQAVGTGGLPMFLPAGGINAAPNASLFGRALVPIEYASTLGTAGDITLADLSQYVLADKRGMQAATSMHVRFLTDEMTFRFTYRVDGEPLWHTALTPFKGSNTKSPFVALANR